MSSWLPCLLATCICLPAYKQMSQSCTAVCSWTCRRPMDSCLIASLQHSCSPERTALCLAATPTLLTMQPLIAHTNSNSRNQSQQSTMYQTPDVWSSLAVQQHRSSPMPSLGQLFCTATPGCISIRELLPLHSPLPSSSSSSSSSGSTLGQQQVSRESLDTGRLYK